MLHSENPEEWNPSDYAFHLTRRARGLPLWFSLAVNGLDAYRDAVEAGLAIAQRAAETDRARRRTSNWCASPGSPSCSSGGSGWDKADYEAWSARLLADQIGFVTPTTWEGETVARFAFLHPNTTVEMVDEILGLNGRRVTRRVAAGCPASPRPARPGSARRRRSGSRARR